MNGVMQSEAFNDQMTFYFNHHDLFQLMTLFFKFSKPKCRGNPEIGFRKEGGIFLDDFNSLRKALWRIAFVQM